MRQNCHGNKIGPVRKAAFALGLRCNGSTIEPNRHTGATTTVTRFKKRALIGNRGRQSPHLEALVLRSNPDIGERS